MTTEWIPRFVFARPFEPFSVLLCDGREVQVHRPDHVAVGEHLLTLCVFHPSAQVEVIDTGLIVSIRTLRRATFSTFFR